MDRILTLLRRSEAYWSAEAIAQQLQLPKDVVAPMLVAMAKAGLLAIGSETGAYRYAPKDNAITAFSDAFRLKKP